MAMYTPPIILYQQHIAYIIEALMPKNTKCSKYKINANKTL